MDKALGGTHFSTNYRDSCFLEWYKLGKPTLHDFWLKMSTDEFNRRPSKVCLYNWSKEWKVKAAELDAEIEVGIIEETIAEKVEMLRRHADEAREIQTISLNYLRENKEQLTPNAAVRLLQLGVEIERQSVGVPEALEKMSKLDDESLLSEISSILQSSEVDIELLDNPV